MRNRLGIYFHVPFCKQACAYCDFHFSTQTKLASQMLHAQSVELLHYASLYSDALVETVYFGGGTPSLLEANGIGQWMDSIHRHYNVSSSLEMTLEINPDDITIEKIQQWKSIGVNRFSVGIQSFDNRVLKWMNRAHTGIQAKAGVQMLQDAGFENITVDLIYGHGQLSHADWLKDVDEFVSLKVPHMSAYALTIEPATSLHHQAQKGTYIPPEDEQTVNEFLHLHQSLGQLGYAHYEVSNYALSGFESRHNKAYLEGHPYLGIGPSAHSFDGKNRRYNIANNPQYIRMVESNDWEKIVEWDWLDEKARWNEMWLIGLRTMNGVNIHELSVNKLFLKSMQIAIDNWVRSGHLIIDGNQLTCTPLGWMVLDQILLDFFAE